jgi:glycosyltransferase involved in cell wall biosynthesis
MPDSSRTVAGTVTTRGQLPAARVLARTYLDYHPDHDVVVVVVDGPGDESGPRIVGGDWLEIDNDAYLALATGHSAAELVDAVIPLMLRRVLEHADIAVYLDRETQVMAPFADVTRLAEHHDIVLAPRLLAPLPLDGREPNAELGSFDRGFLAVGQGAKPFLDFWAERAAQSPPGAHQDWFDRIPGLFRYQPVRDPGLAVAYWNLHERHLSTGPDGTSTAAGSPLRFLHFSGYDTATPWLLSADCAVRPRVVISDSPQLRHLSDAYRTMLLAAGDAQDVAYGFGRMPDGSLITEHMRELFHAGWLKSGRADFAADLDVLPAHPFGADGGRAFRRWLAEPSSPEERNAGVSRLAIRVWTSRPDLQVAFRRPLGEDAAGFRHWCRTHGVAEGLLPEWASLIEPPPIEPPVAEFGVNVAGYLTAEFGLGEQGRLVHRAVQHANIPVVSVIEERSLSCRTDLAQPETVGAARFPVSILSVNADFTQLLLDAHPTLGHQRYRIGLWAWELEDFPPSMRTAFGLLDEVWTVSEFTRRAIAPHSPVPVKAIPMPVSDPGEPQRRPGDITRFLFVFDFNSTGQRKNPWGLVTAFQQAFPGREDVQLVIKATNGRLHPSAVQRLRYVIGDDRRIDLRERYLSVDELNDLYASSDAYVSLHRSEGFGLTVAEAMVRGMPVIATDYGGSTEFFNADVGWPIRYELTEVGPGWLPYQADARWAAPDQAEAANAMRAVADDPAEAARRGAAAREHILRTRSMDRTANWIRTEVENAYRIWQSRQNSAAAARGPFVPALRRVARRAVRRLNEPTSNGPAA